MGIAGTPTGEIAPLLPVPGHRHRRYSEHTKKFRTHVSPQSRCLTSRHSLHLSYPILTYHGSSSSQGNHAYLIQKITLLRRMQSLKKATPGKMSTRCRMV